MQSGDPSAGTREALTKVLSCYDSIKMSKPQSEMIEGPEAFQRFNSAMKAVLAVPHSVIKQRIEEHRKQSALNPNRRGPKRKTTPRNHRR
jgi:hypothetical protein